MGRNFLDINDLSGDDLRQILAAAGRMKQEWKSGNRERQRSVLANKTLAMIFEQPSTRTRVSFDVAMTHLGGHALVLSSDQLQLGRGETIADTARVMSRFVDCIMLRTGEHAHLVELANHASVPVINGLTNLTHPCQVMADVMTFEDHVGPIGGRTVAWIGDGNNMVRSWLHAAARLGFVLRMCCPDGYQPDGQTVAWARQQGADVRVCASISEAVSGADCVTTDTWVSMSDRDADQRRALFADYCVDAAVMAKAAPHAIFMHCLPAHRGEEVTDEVMDGPQSVVFDEAENRLHVQKAILAWCMQAAG